MPMEDAKALIILTSIDRIPSSDHMTGFYMDEMATPYWALRDAGVSVDFASIAGGEPPVDPGSLGKEGERPWPVRRFLDDKKANAKLKNSVPVSEVNADDYDLVFLPGGHGTMWDFAQSQDLAKLVGRAFDANAVVGAVCHGPSGLLSAKSAAGYPIVQGRRINAFTDSEERAVELDKTVPYLLETELRAQGAVFESADDFQAHAVRDGNLVTGQNPASAGKVAELLLEALRERKQIVT